MASSLQTGPRRVIDHRATEPIRHGGNQSAIRARLKLGDQPLLDFSAPLNALGPPPGGVAAVREAMNSIDRYPEPDSPRLVRRLADFHGVPPDRIIVGAGTTELISLIGQVFREQLTRRAMELGDSEMPLAHLFEPSYGEYRRTSAQHGLRTRVWNDHILGWEQDDLPEDAVGLFWTGHPNNPTGRAWDRETLLGLIDRSPELTVIVDEAYLPFLPDEADRTLVQAVTERENLIVLRSMTKIYSIPGLRIGYAVAPPEIVKRLRRCQQPWTVTTAAEVAALASLDDEDYLQNTIELITTEAIRLTDRLWDVPGIRPAWPERSRPSSAPSLPNFVLVSLVDTPWTSTQAQDALARRGLLVRECSNYRGLEVGSIVTGPNIELETRGHLRFCVRTPAENDLLLSTLTEIMTSAPEA